MTTKTSSPLLPQASGELLRTFEVGQKDNATGNSITVSDVTVKKVTPTPGSELLPDSFSYNFIDHVSKGGGRAEEPNAKATEASLFYHGYGSESATEKEAFHAQLIIRTGITPAAGTPYAVSFDAKGAKAQTGGIDILYGSTSGGESCYGRLNGQSLSTEAAAFTYKFAAQESKGELIIRLQVGNTATDNTVTVSNLQIHALTVSSKTDNLIGGTAYNISAVSIEAASGYTVTPEAENDKTLKVAIVKDSATTAAKGNVKLLIDTGAVLTVGKAYQINATVRSENDQTIDLSFDNGSTAKGYVDGSSDITMSDYTVTPTVSTLTREIASVATVGSATAGYLKLCFELGNTSGNVLTISNIEVKPSGSEPETLTIDTTNTNTDRNESNDKSYKPC